MSVQPVHSEGDQPWDFFGRNDAKAEAPVLWTAHAKSWLIGKDWCWEGLGAKGEEDDWGWDGWMASRTRWTWVWVNSRSWWWTGRPGMLWCMGSQRVGHDWATELNWTDECARELHSKASKILTFRFFRRKWHWSPVAKKSTPWAHSWLGSLPQRASLGCTWDKAFPYSNCQHGS